MLLQQMWIELVEMGLRGKLEPVELVGLKLDWMEQPKQVQL